MSEMSDTPRTEAESWKPYDTEAGCDMDNEVVDADFARQLERELNALRLELDTLKAAVSLYPSGQGETNVKTKSI